MRNIKLRVLSIVISFMMVVSLFPVSIFADADVTDLSNTNDTESTTISTVDELKAAIANGGEVILSKDVDLGSEKVTIASGKTVTLDLNGHTLSGTCDVAQGHMIMVSYGATLNIKNSTGDGKITYAQGTSNVGWAIDVEGTVNLYSGTVELTGTPWSIGYAFDVRPNAWGTAYETATVLHMYGGKVISSDGAIRVASSSSPTYDKVAAEFIMDGGEIEAAWDGIFIQQSNEAYDVLTVTVNGGKISSALAPFRFYGPAATSVVNGSEKPVTLTINDGTFVNTNYDSTRTWVLDKTIALGGGASVDEWMSKTTLDIKGGTFEADPSDLVSIGYKVVDNGDGTFTVTYDGPNATVSVLEPMTLVKGEYQIFNGGLSESTDDLPLQIIMNFKSNETPEQAANGGYGDWICDFYLTFTGIESESLTPTGCYLAGNYDPFGWIAIPVEDMTDIKNNVEYPVITSVGIVFSYTDICTSVKDFIAAIYITPEILEANPNFTVELALKLTHPEDATKVLTVGTHTYTAADLLGDNVDIDDDVINTIIDNTKKNDESLSDEQIEAITNTVTNTVTEIKENTSLMGYAPKNVPEDAELVIKLKDIVTETTTEATQATKIVYDVAPMKDGNKVDNNTITETITFRLPIPSSITDDFVNVYHNNELMGTFAVNGNGTNGRYVEVSTKRFSEFAIERTAEKMVAQIGNTGYATLESAVTKAEDGDTITLLADVELDATLEVTKAITIDGNGFSIKASASFADTDSAIRHYSGTCTGTFTLKNIVFDGWTTDHVVRIQRVTFVMDGCTFQNCNQTSGLALLSLTFSDATVKDCKFIGNTCKEAIDINSWGDTSTQAVTVSGCTFDNNTITGTAVIYYNTGSGFTLTNNRFTNNVVTNTSNAGIVYFSNGANCYVTNNVFDSNEITGGARAGALVLEPDVDVTNNVFKDNTTTATYAAQVVFKGDEGTSIDLSDNYWGGNEPGEGDIVTAKPNTSYTCKAYYTQYTLYTSGSFTLGGYVDNRTYVAQIGNTKYETLQDAINAAEAGETVKIISNIALAEGVTVPANATIVIDLNGYTVSRDTEATTSTAAITNNGNLTIKDSVGSGKITAFAKNPDTAGIPYYANNTITNHGILTVEGGTIENSTSDEARAAFPIDNNSGSHDAIVYIKGGVITGRGAIRQFANSTTHKNEVIITGGVVNVSSYAIWVQNPNSNDNSAKLTVSGGDLAKIIIDPSANFEISITGGTVSEVTIRNADTANPDRNPSEFITGGTFTTDVSDFCADGYAVKDNGDGTFSVVADPAAGKVAVVGDTYYETLEEAFAEAPNGETIKLIADVVLESPIIVGKDRNITLELNGKTITYNSTTQGEAMITNKGTLTINDSVGTGVINYNYVGAADPNYGKGNYTISNCGTLTVNGGKITIANLSRHAKYPIDNNSTSGDAILVINGGHLYNYNTSAIRQFCNSTTFKNSVTINGGLIEGYSAVWVQNPGSKTVHGSLTITGGEIRTTAAAYINGTSELKDVSSKIYCTTEGGAWSDDSAISITGGTFNENVYFAEEAPENITIGEGATFNGRVELPEKAPAIVVPDDVVDSIVGDNTADRDTVQEIVDEIQNNTAVNDESYKPVEGIEGVEELIVSLNGMTVTTGETTTVTEIVYTVTPQDANGEKVSTPAQPITFKLPIPAGMTGTLVEVLHNKVSIGLYKILGESEHRYVEIESESFSTFTVKTTDTTYVALVGTQAYATLDEALDAAKSGDVIVLLGNVETDMVFLKKGVILDLAGYTLTADYVTVYTDAAIIDSSNMAGRLVAIEDISIKSNNKYGNEVYMPICLDDKGYAFVPMNLNSLVQDVTSTGMSVIYRPVIKGATDADTTAISNEMFKNGAKALGLTFGVRLTWADANSNVQSKDFTFSDSLIAEVYTNDQALLVKFSGIPETATNLSVDLLVTSSIGFTGTASATIPTIAE